MGGGGNWEFELYNNNRTNSFTEDGILYLQPTLTSDTIGEDQLRTGSMNLWGGAPADTCTSNAFYGCERSAMGSGNVLNPLTSARIRTVNSFNFKYGRVQISAKLPKGDWIWPAIWMLPADNAYGPWPASGEIDIVESRGNMNCEAGGVDSFGSTLHWGPGWPMDPWEKAHAEYKHPEGTLNDEFHTYELEWTAEHIITSIDGVEVLNFPFDEDMFTKGDFDKTINNPWKGETEKSAPFNREYYLIFNVAVGGVNEYFPDGQCDKLWTNDDPHSVNTFYNAKETWYKTWNYPETHQSAMQIDWVKVYSFDDAGNEVLEQ
jgi:beta-glucanase (GH16 family)